MLENRFSPLPCRHLSFTLCLFLHGSNSKRWDPDAGNDCWRGPILPTDPRVYSAAHIKFETIFHTIGILMTCLNTSISPSLIKTEISRGKINRHTFLFVHEETKHGRVKKLVVIWKTLIKQSNSYSCVTKWVLSEKTQDFQIGTMRKYCHLEEAITSKIYIWTS